MIHCSNVSNTITGSISGSLTGNATRVTISTITGTADVPIVLVSPPPGGISSDNLLCVSATPRLSFNPLTRLINATSSWAQSSSFVTGSIFTNTNPALSSSYALSSSNALSSSRAVTASYALTATTADSATTAGSATTADTANAIADPLRQDLTIDGTFIVNNSTYDVLNTSKTLLYDSASGASSLNWDSRQLFYPDGSTVAIDYSNTEDYLYIQNFNNDGKIIISSSNTITLNGGNGSVNIYRPYIFVPTGSLKSDADNYLLTNTVNGNVGSVPFQSFSKIIGKNTSPTTISGTGDQISISSSLTAGIVETGSIIRVTTRIIKTSAAGATTASIYYESPSSLPNSILLGQYIIPTGNVYAQMQRDLIVQNNGTTTMFNASSSALTDVTSSNAGFTVRNINWGFFGDGGTRNISVYLSNLNSGDSGYAASLLIEKL